jgi:hypothetical protein
MRGQRRWLRRTFDGSDLGGDTLLLGELSAFSCVGLRDSADDQNRRRGNIAARLEIAERKRLHPLGGTASVRDYNARSVAINSTLH